jgi:hypothetical protein
VMRVKAVLRENIAICFQVSRRCGSTAVIRMTLEGGSEKNDQSANLPASMSYSTE